MAAKTCAICGKPSGMYPLCRDCFKLRDEGKIEQCPDCKTWHYTNKPCECKKITEKSNKEIQNIEKPKEELSPVFEAKNQPSIVTIDYNNKSKCITCGKPTDGLLFCGQCYKKYKDKELLFRIKKCSEVELLDESYEGLYTCKDGHIVKSKSEREIDNYLFEHGIAHAYEKELSYGSSAKEVLHPDFYLHDYLGEKKHVYIEHWGYNENNKDYEKTFKMQIYKQTGITLICTYEKSDMAKIDSVLERKLNREYIKENEINYPTEE